MLAGGSGSRLWPLSSIQRPKQLLPFIGDKSLLDQALDRIGTLGIPKENIFIITNTEQEEAIRSAVGDVIGSFVLEPCARNTAAALLLGCYHIYAHDPDAVVLFVPADHFVPDERSWVQAVKCMLQEAEQSENIVLLGLKPSFPATGYGYIQASKNNDQNALPVVRFHEKPALEAAQLYMQCDDMFWNIGMFAARVSVFLEEVKLHAPAVYHAMQDYLDNKKSYDQIPSISIDYAVMEKTQRAVLIPAAFTWYDVGNISIFLSLQSLYNNINANVVNVAGKNNLVSTKKKVVACVGVSNLCIVETEDTLLIVAQDQAELVKEVVGKVHALREIL